MQACHPCSASSINTHYSKNERIRRLCVRATPTTVPEITSHAYPDDDDGKVHVDAIELAIRDWPIGGAASDMAVRDWPVEVACLPRRQTERRLCRAHRMTKRSPKLWTIWLVQHPACTVPVARIVSWRSSHQKGFGNCFASAIPSVDPIKMFAPIRACI